MIEFIRAQIQQIIPLLATVKGFMDEVMEIPYFKVISAIVGIGGAICFIIQKSKKRH